MALTKPISEAFEAIELQVSVQTIDVGLGFAQVVWKKMSMINTVLDSGMIIMDGQDYANWGTDDNYLMAFVESKLYPQP